MAIVTAGALLSTGIAMAIACAAAGTWRDALIALPLFVLVACAGRLVSTIGEIDYTGEYLPIILAAAIEPRLAPIVACGTLLSTHFSPLARIYNSGGLICAAAAAGFAASLTPQAGSYPQWLLVVAFAAGAFAVVDQAISSVGVVLAGHHQVLKMMGDSLRALIPSMLLSAPVAAWIARFHQRDGIWVLPVAGVLVLLIQYVLAMYTRKVELTVQLEGTVYTLARANLQFAAAMVRALDARDSYTAGHSAAVAVYCRDIAREAGFDEPTVQRAHLAGLLHDIGKIGVPGTVLNKPGRLTPQELACMHSHAKIGARILGEVDDFADLSVIVRHHHERIDGGGYPDAIGGEAIPELSRIISVADTYSAMTTDRPYRAGMPPARAIGILQEVAGTQLDVFHTECFLRVLARESASYRRGKLVDFDVEVATHAALGELDRLAA